MMAVKEIGVCGMELRWMVVCVQQMNNMMWETWAHIIFRAMNCLINLKIFTYLDFKRVGPLLFACDVDVIDKLCKCNKQLFRLGYLEEKTVKQKLFWRQSLIYPCFGSYGVEGYSVNGGIRWSFNLVNSCLVKMVSFISVLTRFSFMFA